MSEVRNSKELGPILYKVAQYLSSNQNLSRYLVYSDENPLDPQKEDIQDFTVINNNILVVPLINSKDFTTAAKICLLINNGRILSNSEFKGLSLSIFIYTPFKSWTMNDIQLRPFAIIGEIEQSLRGKSIESLGQIKYEGFELDSIDDDMSCYRMDFGLDVFN